MVVVVCVPLFKKGIGSKEAVRLCGQLQLVVATPSSAMARLTQVDFPRRGDRKKVVGTVIQFYYLFLDKWFYTACGMETTFYDDSHALEGHGDNLGNLQSGCRTFFRRKRLVPGAPIYLRLRRQLSHYSFP